MLDGYMMWSGLGWIGMGLMMLFWIAVIALVIWGLSVRAPASPGGGAPDALQVLKRRYARGEITHAEYLQARDALR